MDLAFFIRNRLRQLWLSSRDRARASSRAESYIASSQTVSNQTDPHDQLERVLQLPQGYLAKLADLQRRAHRLKKPFENRTRLERDCNPDCRAAVYVDAGSGSIRTTEKR
jgi:hypothetical protein